MGVQEAEVVSGKGAPCLLLKTAKPLAALQSQTAGSSGSGALGTDSLTGKGDGASAVCTDHEACAEHLLSFWESEVLAYARQR